jgi:beta-lactamase superfamily II metal-dependent hydrolase
MKVCKVWIFDIGRGFSSVIRTPSHKWIMIDLGSSAGFNPVHNFLIPKIRKSNFNIKDGKFCISQLIITHPHNDHITAIKDFDGKIYPGLLTVPNDIEHLQQPPKAKVNWNLITNQSDDLTNYLRKKMLPGRQPPLRATKDDNIGGFVFKIYYLMPKICEHDSDLQKENYTNNISIMARLNYKGNVVFFTGDMMKDGFEKILSMNSKLRDDLSAYGVDFLISPHHGLRSSFSTELFKSMKGHKTNGINIVPERKTPRNSNEIVDSRYAEPEYSKGHPVILNGKRKVKRMLRTSSVGHIRIDLLENKETRVIAGKSALNFI